MTRMWHGAWMVAARLGAMALAGACTTGDAGGAAAGSLGVAGGPAGTSAAVAGAAGSNGLPGPATGGTSASGLAGSAGLPMAGTIPPPPPPPQPPPPPPPPTGGTGVLGGTGASGTGGVSGTGVSGAGVSGTGASGTGASGTGGNPNDTLDAVRQACVDHINMYRAPLGLAPLSRGTPDQEACSDVGCKSDSELYAATGQAHASAGDCSGLGAQNTCPGWPLRGGGTLESTMKQCLDSMWDEGEPPIGVSACIQDRAGCFLMYGHWINMTSTTSSVVACGFYEMPNGSWWMNQNFGR